jgi:DNA-directed RNA polymerase subunit beta'
MMNKPNKENFTDFDALKLTLASPDDVLDWSFGEVTKAETINYRTFRPEPDGLFCEKIFGPSKNYECYCGKYKKVRYRGIICDKCGVEVTTKDVRRERMGHIKLAVPVAHVWFAYGIPNKMQMVLNISYKKLLSVIYYTRYMVVGIDEEKKDAIIKKAEGLRDEDTKMLNEQLDTALKEEASTFDAEIKALKKEKDKKAAEFKKSQIEHRKNQAQAKVRREFAQQEETLDGFWTKILQLIEKMEVGSILSEDEYVDLSDRDLLFFDAKMGAEAVETLLANFDLHTEAQKLAKKAKKEKGDAKANTIRRLQYIQGFIKNNIKPNG